MPDINNFDYDPSPVYDVPQNEVQLQTDRFDFISGVTDTTKPVVAVVSPSPSSQINTDTPLVLDVTDNLALFRRILLVVTVSGVREVVHDGSSFSTNYVNSTRASITNGYRYTVLRLAGWPVASSIYFEGFAIDTAGNEAL